MRQHSSRASAKRLSSSAGGTDDLGPAWISLRRVLQLMESDGEGAEAIALLTDVIANGTLTVFTSGLWGAASNDDFELTHLTRMEATSRGWAAPSLAGPTERSFALSIDFWKIGDISTALTHWSERKGGLEIVEAKPDAASRRCLLNWEIRSPVISTFQFELLQKYIKLGAYASPKPKKAGGRHRTPKWDDWTAQLAELVHTEGISPVSDASDLANLIERQLHARNRESVDRTSARMTLETVIRHSGTYVGSPKT